MCELHVNRYSTHLVAFLVSYIHPTLSYAPKPDQYFCSCVCDRPREKGVLGKNQCFEKTGLKFKLNFLFLFLLKSFPCILLTRDAIERDRAESLELSRGELGLVILAQLRACCTVQDQPSLRSTHHKRTTDQCMTKYYGHGLQIRRKTFMFLHHVSRKRLCSRVHSNTMHLTTNALIGR